MTTMQPTQEQLETRIAWLEQANAELSDELYRQRQQIEALQARMGLLSDRLEAARANPTEYSPTDEKPPHY